MIESARSICFVCPCRSRAVVPSAGFSRARWTVRSCVPSRGRPITSRRSIRPPSSVSRSFSHSKRLHAVAAVVPALPLPSPAVPAPRPLRVSHGTDEENIPACHFALVKVVLKPPSSGPILTWREGIAARCARPRLLPGAWRPPALCEPMHRRQGSGQPLYWVTSAGSLGKVSNPQESAAHRCCQVCQRLKPAPNFGVLVAIAGNGRNDRINNQQAHVPNLQELAP